MERKEFLQTIFDASPDNFRYLAGQPHDIGQHLKGMNRAIFELAHEMVDVGIIQAAA